MSSRPRSHMSNGGIDCVASSLDQRRQRLDVVALERARRTGRAARGRSSSSSRGRRPDADLCARERRAGALERAVHGRDARLQQLGDLGRPASAAPRRGSARHAAAAAGAAAPRRTPGGSSRGRSRTSAGSPRPDDEPSGIGWIQSTSGSVCRFDSIGSQRGPRSIGSARRLRPLSMSKHTFVAMRYSQDRSADRPSNRS